MLGIGRKINLIGGISLKIIEDIKYAFRNANVAEKIIYINVVLFLVTVLFSGFVNEWFALPTDFNSFVSKPWTLITYAFIHNGLLHILSNLIILYYIGNLFLNFFNPKQFISCYFSGVVFGGIAFLLNYYLTGKTGLPLGGASAAVSAIFIAIATKIPRYALQLRFIGSVELWVLAAIWIVLSILQLATIDNGGAIAHVSGALIGYLYASFLNKGLDIGKWTAPIFGSASNLFQQQKKSPLKTVYKSSTKNFTDEVSKTKQRKIDDILDKISKSGYDSLNAEEKEFLFRAGKK